MLGFYDGWEALRQLRRVEWARVVGDDPGVTPGTYVRFPDRSVSPGRWWTGVRQEIFDTRREALEHLASLIEASCNDRRHEIAEAKAALEAEMAELETVRTMLEQEP